MKNKFLKTLATGVFFVLSGYIQADTAPKAKPNIILFFADDISAREIPIYGSSVWSPPEGGNTSDPQFRAKTPVLDKMATEGIFVKSTWAATVCSPSRAMMMTGRYAHLHKWWQNKDVGTYITSEGKKKAWPLYMSSPLLIGHVAQNAGYATYWAGKTQMRNSDLSKFGFEEGIFTPGEESTTPNPYSDFVLMSTKEGGKQTLINRDNDKTVESYAQASWYWKPNVQLMNYPGAKEQYEWWPITSKDQKEFGLNTYGPDVEQKFIFDFMDRQQKAGKPFFVYHTSHLGHDAFNWLIPDTKTKWPGTPIVKWENGKYIRTEPNITGDKGVYDLHKSITEPGIHNQINYIDYQLWRYMQKMKEMGIDKNTILIFCADNGTSGYGKNSPEIQKGCHVPLIIYAPGFNFTKKGEQDIIANLADILPTIADIVGYKIPKDYEINGISLWPYLTTNETTHRDWIYSYHSEKQLIRSSMLLRDGKGNWYDVSANPSDLISFPQIKDWGKASKAENEERDRLNAILPQFNLHDTEHDAPEK